MLVGALGGCVSDRTYNKAIADLDANWQAKNAQTLTELGQRTIDSTKYSSFVAVQGATRRLHMIIEEEDYATGFLFASSAAPTPLTSDEWAEVQKVETPGMREVLSESLGVLSQTVELDPSGKDLLANVFVTERDEGVEVSVSIRLRNNLAQGDRVRRMEPPPLAVRLGLEKFWAAFDAELDSLSAQDETQPEIDVEPTVQTAEPSSDWSRPSRIRRPNNDGIAVLIGNNRYPDPIPSVDYAHNDAAAMKEFVVQVLGYCAPPHFSWDVGFI